MVRIDSQDQLKQELSDLQEKGYLQSNGPLERRGVEVDHNLYPDRERMHIGTLAADDNTSAAGHNSTSAASSQQIAPQTSPAVAEFSEETLSAIEKLTSSVQEQADLIRSLESMLVDMDDRLQKLERDLGV